MYTSVVNSDCYINEALNQIPRLLSHLDRNPYSPTYGSFDWLYWSEKWHESPIGRQQEFCLVLALLYKFNFPGSEQFYQNAKILEWCIASMKYWCKMQHDDGSVDENYYNERQFGATAFTLYAIAKSFLLIEDEIKEEDKEMILNRIEKAADFIAGYDETYLLTNHQTMAIIAMHLAGKVLSRDYNKPIESKLGRIFAGKSKDGWLKEYSGADLGYLTISISNLAEYNEDVNRSDIKQILNDSVEFISYFLTGDGTFGGILGVRNTCHFWCNGFAILSEENPVACAIVDWGKKMLSKKALLTPAKDDWYFGNLVCDILLSYLYDTGGDNFPKLPFEQTDFVKYFEDSKMLVQKSGGNYLIANGFKGGLIRAWDCSSGALIKSDAGLIGRLKSGGTITTNWPDPNYEVEYAAEEGKLKITGQFHCASFEYPTFMKFTLFKLFNIVCGYSVKITNFIKDILIRKLITKEKTYPVSFERQIDLSDLKIDDTIKIEEKGEFESLTAADELVLIGMGYAKYFYLSELNTKVYVFSQEEIEYLNKMRNITVKH